MLSRTNISYGFFNFNSLNNNLFFNNSSLNSWNNNYFNNSRTNNLFSFNNTNNWLNNSFTNRNTFNLFNTNNNNNNSFWNNIVWTTQPALNYDRIDKPTVNKPENTQPTSTVDPKEPEQSDEIGSKEHIAKLLDADLSNYVVSKTDDKGRAIELSTNSNFGDVIMAIGQVYSISYNDTTGEISITPSQKGICGASVDTYTYNSEGRLVKSVSTNPSLGPGGSENVIEYAEDGSKTETRTYIDPSRHKGIAKVVTQYDADGEITSIKQYDAEGNEIKENPNNQSGGTRWETEQKPLFSKILGTDLNDDIYEFKFDEEGRVVEIQSKLHTFGPSGYTSSPFGLMSPTGYCDTTSGYRVSYDDNGNITIIKYTKTTPTDSKGNATGESEIVNIEDAKKYDADGNEIHETGDLPVLDPNIWGLKDIYY